MGGNKQVEKMNIKGQITIRISGDGATIEIDDKNASTRILNITLTAEQLCKAMGRQAHVECDIEVGVLERVGKIHENKDFEFQINESFASSKFSKELQQIAQSELTDGWIAETYFSSQNSFFKKDGKQFARVTIRRWIIPNQS